MAPEEALVKDARSPALVFGREADERQARREYRRLARMLHPDAGGDSDLFARLQQLWDRAQEQFQAGTYGRDLKLQGAEYEFLLGDQIARGDVATLYVASYDGGHAAVKIPRSPKHSSLMQNEARALRRLHGEGDKKYRAYAPQLIDAFRYKDADTGARRVVNALQPLDGFYTLREVREAYPIGLDSRDMAWMLRRLLVAIGWAYEVGLSHGAVTPDHVMIHPEKHGVVLVDWTLAGSVGDKLAYRPKAWSDMYPDDKKLSRHLDAHLVASTVEYLIRDTAPSQIKAFLNGCRIGKVPHPWKLKEEFDQLLEMLYGPRRFRPFHMPDQEGR